MFTARARVIRVSEKSTSTFTGHQVMCEISGDGIAPQQITVEVSKTTSIAAAEAAGLRLLQAWCRAYLKSVDAAAGPTRSR
ncbi:MAG: hypothetical protein K2R93_16055 [Gemmatimonadaceae bacterium]|nr:hypothetical protein [Gemmatimonadaceae bacterium]